MSRLQKIAGGRGGLLLYLDFDGVLHHENVVWHPKAGAYLAAPPPYRLFQHAELLEDLLAPYPDVGIVLSTSWVRVYGFSRATRYLTEGLQRRVIGATFHSAMNRREFLSMSRGMQVWADVHRRQPKDWLALDDDYHRWPRWCVDNYIRTHAFEGISDPPVQETIRQQLRQMCETDKRLRDLPGALGDGRALHGSSINPDRVGLTCRQEQSESPTRTCGVAITSNPGAFGSMNNASESSIPRRYPQYGRVLGRAAEVFGNTTIAWVWLNTPHVSLGSQRPIDLLDDASQAEQILDILAALKYGGGG